MRVVVPERGFVAKKRRISRTRVLRGGVREGRARGARATEGACGSAPAAGGAQEASLVRLEALHHVDASELAPHRHHHEHGERHGERKGDSEAGRMDDAAEHHLVDLGRDHDEPFHPHAQHQTDKASDGREKHDLAVDVGVHLPRRETEHFERGNLTHPLGDVDVREVVQHDESERRRGGHQHHHDHVHARKHLAIGVDRLVVVGDGPHALDGAKPLRSAARACRDRR